MASRKQKRRREKLQRHEWEEVYVDADGNELDADEAEDIAAPARAAKGAKAQPAQRGRRVVDPPSWRRTLKRGALFFPLMLVVVFVLGSNDNTSTPAKIVSTLFLMAFFLPFSYFLDTMVWRATQRRLAKSAPPSKKR